MKPVLQRLVFLALLFFTSMALKATTYYVSTSGSDIPANGTLSAPWKTIKYATEHISGSGHTIQVLAGTFVENGPINIPTGVNLFGSGVGQTTIMADSSYFFNYTGSEDYGQHFLIQLNSNNYTEQAQILKDFTIDGSSATAIRQLHGGISIYNRGTLTLENIHIQYTGFCGLWLQSVKNSLVRNVSTRDCSWGSTSWASGAIQVADLVDVEFDDLDISEDRGYGMKGLPHEATNFFTGLKIHDSRFSVNPTGLWADGNAPNITLELWAPQFPRCEIYRNYFDNTLSLVNNSPTAPHTQPGGQTFKVYDNTFDILAPSRANGHGYGLESSVNDVEIYGNHFSGGYQGIASFMGHKHYNWKIHHNVFYGLANSYPTSAVFVSGGDPNGAKDGGVIGLTILNNTMEMTGPTTLSLYNAGLESETENVVIKNNLVINNSTGGQPAGEPNRVIRLGTPATTMTPPDMTHNNFYNVPAGHAGSLTGNLTYNPLITASGNKPSPYYTLMANSPLVDAGTNVGFTFFGANPDIGAYEYNPSSPGNPGGDPDETGLIALRFDENSGTTPANIGTAGGAFTRTSPVPAWVTNTPDGGGSALDFAITNGNNVVESNGVIEGLKNQTAFTITGWLNCKSNAMGGGGNRVISWINGGGDGVDLVYKNDGSLQLGIDQWPDGSPAVSSINKVPTNASAIAGNWIFFAVTYQSSTGQVKFYFGNTTTDASLDATRAYSRGAVGANIGPLAIGHFNSVTRSGAPDRMFKGLIDEIRIHDAELAPADIINIQRKGADTQAPTAPVLTWTSKTTNSVSLSWSGATDNLAVTGYDVYQGPTLVTSTSSVTYTVANLLPNTSYSFSVKAKDAINNISAASNIVTVTTNAAPLISLPFNETSGTAPANSGTAGGTFSRTGAVSSTIVPVNGGLRAVDFGTSNGDNVVESAAIINDLKNLNAFTITGWVNCKSSTMGGGGNRIISWINNGGDGVDLVYKNDGSLQLGIDQWPDASPAFSSINKVPTNASAPATNWVFFAVTYQSSANQVQFYFGNNATDATLDVTRTYNRGPVGSNIAKLAIGHFNSMTRSGALDRMFKGLIDEVQVHGAVLTPQDIVAIQRGTGTSPSGGRLAASEKPQEQEQVNEEVHFRAYPNPSKEGDIIYLELPDNTGELKITDMVGKPCLTLQVTTKKTSIATDGFPGGLYLLRYRNAKTATSIKVIIN